MDSVLINSVDYDSDGDVRIEGWLSEGDGKHASKINIISYPDGMARAVLTPSEDSTRVKRDVELFRLTDLADVMEKKGWKVGAHLQRQWFKRSALEMTSSEKRALLKSRQSLDYRNDAILSNSWLMGHSRMNTYFRSLRSRLMLPPSRNVLTKILNREGAFNGNPFKRGIKQKFKANMSLINSDRREYHKRFQFQRVEVDTGVQDQANIYFSGSDDLWASFGGFSFYAGICDVTLYGISDEVCAVTLENFITYAIDSYDFIDDGQYLGHWNKHDVKVVAKSMLQQTNMPSPAPVRKSRLDLQSMYNLFFCVKNGHFNKYRKKFGKGGDMFVWTQPALYSLGGQEFTFYVKRSDIK